MSDDARVIDSIKKTDVLLGRGKRVHIWEGNVRFRSLCKAHSSSYLATSEVLEKDRIVNDVISKVKIEGGRFLRETEITDNNEGTTHHAWVTVPITMIRSKVKQAFRDTARIRVRHRKLKVGAGKGTTQLSLEEELRVSRFQRDEASHSLYPQTDKLESIGHQLSPAESNEPTDRELLGALMSMYRAIQRNPSLDPSTSIPRDQPLLRPHSDQTRGFCSSQSVVDTEASLEVSNILTTPFPSGGFVSNFSSTPAMRPASVDQQVGATHGTGQYAYRHYYGAIGPLVPPSYRYGEHYYEQRPPVQVVPSSHRLPVSALTLDPLGASTHDTQSDVFSEPIDDKEFRL